MEILIIVVGILVLLFSGTIARVLRWLNNKILRNRNREAWYETLEKKIKDKNDESR